MVAICWMLKQRVCENMRTSWTRKREDQLHTFNWEATLMVPTAAGRRPVRTSAGGSRECYHAWFAGMPEVLKHFQQALFYVADPISRDATRFSLHVVADAPFSQAVLMKCHVSCHGRNPGCPDAQGIANQAHWNTLLLTLLSVKQYICRASCRVTGAAQGVLTPRADLVKCTKM